VSSQSISEARLTTASNKALLAQVREYIQFVRGDLAGEEPLTEEEAMDFAYLMSVVDEGIKLPPRVVPLPIIDQDHLTKDLAGGVPVDIGKLTEGYAFYYVQVPITLFPKRGFRFREIEVRLVYNPGMPTSEKPLSYDIFPERKWLQVVSLQEDLELVLDESAHFKLQPPGTSQALLLLGTTIGQGTAQAMSPEIALALTSMGVDIGAKLAAEVKAGATIKLGPFHYLIRRALTRSEGRGNDLALWRFSAREDIDADEELHVAVVLQVPRTLKTVKITPLVLADLGRQSLQAKFEGVIQSLKGALGTLKDLFGDEAEEKILSFEDQIGRGWPIKVGGDKAWDISDELTH
jgi:hypothetical protein